jgi:signal transduction histidine kinase/ActR/RegA family two-component response regulator
MLRKQIWQSAIFSSVILVVVLAVDFLIAGVILADGALYSPLTTIFITLLVAPPFSFFLIHQNARVHSAQASLETERAERLAEVEAARDVAEAATRAKSEFLANMSHEIRTPLNGILGMAQALGTRELDAQTREMVATIRDSGAMLMAILNDVLDLSKIEAGKLDVSPTDVSLQHTLQQVLALFQPVAREKSVGLSLSGDLDPKMRVRYDPVRVRQCVTNLVSNAVKFTREGSVDVNAEITPLEDGRSRVTIAVTDTGIGMDATTLARLFDAFTQADGSTTREFGGTGLGLTISRRLARLMGGDIVARSTQNRGSVFTFTFIAEAARDTAVEIVPRREASQGVVLLRGARVLLTDDNAINRQVVRLFVQPQGAIITEAANGREALDLLAAQPFDLVLLDVHMPVMDGTEAIRQIRASAEAWRDIPVVALTADAMSGDRERLIGMGMSDYVSKPIDQGELLGVIGRVLGGGAHLAPVLPARAVQGEVCVETLLGDLDRIAG